MLRWPVTRYALIPLERYETSDDPIELDDDCNGSNALYRAANTRRITFVYFKPDQQQPAEPRCDYVLVSKVEQCIPPRFIELKGGDIQRQRRCCKTEWDHAFHQIFNTFQEYETYINTESESVIFVLCTSIEKRRIAARFTNYKWYKTLQRVTFGEIKILYRDDYDTLWDLSGVPVSGLCFYFASFHPIFGNTFPSFIPIYLQPRLSLFFIRRIIYIKTSMLFCRIFMGWSEIHKCVS